MFEKLLVKEVVAPICIIFIFLVLYFIISKILKKMMHLRFAKMDEKRKKTMIGLANNVIKYFLLIIAFLMILSVYGIDTSSLIASLGVVGLVVGLAIQDTIKDFVSGLFIIIENQYALGDTITIGDFKGEVIALGLKTTRLKSSTGEVKMISNRNITEVINHTKENALAIVDFQIAYEEDLEKVEEVLEKLCTRLNEELPYLKGKVTYVGVTMLNESGVDLRLTVATKPMMQHDVARMILREIKLEFDKENITIPYPQVVMHRA